MFWRACAYIAIELKCQIFFYDGQVQVHAPMTEILSTLDRTQLQKLVQYAVEDDPAGVLGKVFRHVGMLSCHQVIVEEAMYAGV